MFILGTYAVLGGGNGGQALAAFLKHQGHSVRLWARDSAIVDQMNSSERLIEVYGALRTTVNLDVITTDIKKACEGASILFVVVPANAHFEMACRLAGIIEKNQTVILNPGRTAGVVEFIHTLLSKGLHKEELPLLLETQSLFCACRARNAGVVDILSFKKENVIGGIPTGRIDDVLGECTSVYSNLRVVPDTLVTGLDNMGAFLHPTPVLLNTGWIESRDVFFGHYYQAISPSVAAYIEKMDQERFAIAECLEVPVRSVKQWHEEVYGFQGGTLFETLQGNSTYASIDAPKSLQHRYLTEDIPTGLVPMSELARLLKIPTPHIDAMINLGSAMLGIDFRKEGRNLLRLGFEGKNIQEIMRIFTDGF